MRANTFKLITIPKIKDLRGNLSFVEDNNHVPFKIKRAYWIYDVPGGEERGGHAYFNSSEFIIPLSGAFTVEVWQGEDREDIVLNKTNCGLFLPKRTWRKFTNFVSGSICLVLSDTLYDEKDGIFDFSEYMMEFDKNEAKNV